MLRRIGLILAWAVALVGLAIAGAFGFAQTETGKRLISDQVGRALTSDGSTARLDGLSGLIPFDISLEQLRLADADGPWLEIDDARLSWSPTALLRGRLQIEELGARRVALLRLPPGEEDEASEPLAELPRSIPPVAIQRLNVDELELGQAVLGERAVFALRGALDTPEDGRVVSLGLDLERTDEDTARGSVQARLDLAQRRLALDVTASETGGLLAALTGRPDAGSFTLALQGEGPLADWRGELRAEGERIATAEAQIALAVNDTVRASVDGVLEPAPGLLPAPAPALLGDRVAVALSVVRTDPDRLALDEFRATAAKIEVTGSGRIDLAAEQMAAHAEVAISDLAPLAEVIDTTLAGSLNAVADLEGALVQPQGRVTVEARDIEAAELRAPRIAAGFDLTALDALTARGARVRVVAEGRAEALVPPPDVPLGPQDVAWHAAVVAPVDGAGTVAVDQLRVSADQVALTADGTVDTATLGGEARIALVLDSLRPFTEPYGQPIDGAADLRATVASGARAEVISIDLDGGFRDLSGLPPGAAELLGRAPKLQANAIIVPDDSVELTELRVAGAAATLDGQIEMTLPGQALDGAFGLDLPRLAVLTPVLGTEVDGELLAHAQLGGTVAAPEVRLDAKSPGLLVAGEHIDALTFTGSAHGAADDLRGDLRFALSARGLDAELASDVELRAPTLRLTGLTLTAPRTKVDGDLAIDLERSLIDGELTGRVEEIGAFAALLPVGVRGQLNFEAHASSTGDGTQVVALTARGSQLGSDFGRLGGFGLQANVEDANREPQIAADLTIKDLSRADLELIRGRLSANGTLAALNLTTSLTGEAQFVPFTFDGRANLGLENDVVVRLEALSGRIAEEPLTLARPATLTVAEGSFGLDDLDLRLGGARLTGAFALDPRQVNGQATLDPLPLEMLGRFGGAPDLTGDLVARLTLQGPADNPSGSLEARATGVATPSPMLADLPAAELTLSGVLQARRLRLDLLGEGLTDQPIRLNAELPLVADLAAGVVDVPADGQISGNLDADVRLERLADILALDDQRLEGPLIIDLSVSGTVAQPAANGTIQIENALYENGTTGTVLRALMLRARATRQTITIEQLTANDGGQGRLAGDGTIAIGAAEDYRVDLRLQLDRARLVARDDVTATMSGDLAFDGTVAAPRLSGAITVNRAEILIPDHIGPSVAVLPVEEIGGGATSDSASGNGAGAAFDVGLDLTVDLPGQVFVRGRGLDSEWTGRLHAEGTTSEPRVTGNLQIKRGNFELLGQHFDLRSGTIEFTGASPPNPVIDVQAVTQADDITAVVRVDGEAKAPQFHLDSEPSMPEDEIVSRLLFKRAASRLGPGEAIRLAAAVNTLRGGGLGPLGQARQALGLDTLDVSGEGLEDGQLRAGKYLNDNVYVEVGKGAAADSEEVRLEVEILPNLSLDAGTGANAESGIGLKWRFDY